MAVALSSSKLQFYTSYASLGDDVQKGAKSSNVHAECQRLLTQCKRLGYTLTSACHWPSILHAVTASTMVAALQICLAEDVAQPPNML